MSKKHKNNGSNASETAPEVDTSDTTSTDEPIEAQQAAAIKPPEPTLAELFDAYREASTNVEAAKNALAEAEASQSATIKAIHDARGTGPFKVGDQKMRIRQRKGVYYFLAESEETVIEV